MSSDMALTPRQLQQGFQLGDRLVQPASHAIHGPEGEAHVEPRVMEVLVCLAEHAGEVVSREMLYERVWPDTIVTDQAITNCISELRHHLGDNRAAPRFIKTVPKRGYRLIAPVEEPAPATRGPEPSSRRKSGAGPERAGLKGVTGLLAAVLALAIAWAAWPDRNASLPTIAVLAFENSSGSEDLDYLRHALPDQITTVLTRARGVAVRPFKSGRFESIGEAAGKHNAVNIVTGRYYREGGDRLTVSIEAQNLDHDRLLWHARVTVPLDDTLKLGERIADRVRDGLLPAIGAHAELALPVPRDARAYQLYLRSLAISRDPSHNPRGIGMLENVVERDPEYAPAWASLARRYHDHYSYGGGSDTALAKAREAAERALALDPDLVNAARRLVSLETEAGRLNAAHRRARELMDRRPDSGSAHFALAYVLRYGGMLPASQRHCELALQLDPHNPGWRSCAFAYMAAGELDRAPHFIGLDSDSYWSNLVSVHYWLRRGDDRRSRQYAQRLDPDSIERRFHEACLEHRPGRTPDSNAQPFIRQWESLRDPEPSYWIGSEMVYCGRPDDALRLLETAIDDGYCAYPAVDQDPAWAPLRDRPEFQRLRRAAIACHEAFRAGLEESDGEDPAVDQA